MHAACPFLSHCLSVVMVTRTRSLSLSHLWCVWMPPVVCGLCVGTGKPQLLPVTTALPPLPEAWDCLEQMPSPGEGSTKLQSLFFCHRKYRGNGVPDGRPVPFLPPACLPEAFHFPCPGNEMPVKWSRRNVGGGGSSQLLAPACLPAIGEGEAEGRASCQPACLPSTHHATECVRSNTGLPTCPFFFFLPVCLPSQQGRKAGGF